MRGNSADVAGPTGPGGAGRDVRRGGPHVSVVSGGPACGPGGGFGMIRSAQSDSGSLGELPCPPGDGVGSPSGRNGCVSLAKAMERLVGDDQPARTGRMPDRAATPALTCL